VRSNVSITSRVCFGDESTSQRGVTLSGGEFI
jgi:hypothetical protein